MAKYRVAIIGAGHRAGAHDAKFRGKGRRRLSHADAYSHIEQCELVGAADPNAENLARLCGSYDIPRRFADYRDLLCELKPDIISICTTARPRAEIIIAAAELGVRGIYAEKALCSSMEEADRIRDACRKAGVAFNYGTNRRFDINFGAVRSAVMDGIIGDPEGAGFFGADLIMHGGSHVFDTLMFLLGDPAVGKTSLIRKYVFDIFDDRYLSTVGAKVTKKTSTVEIPEAEVKVDLNLMIWDIAGQKMFNDVHQSYYTGVEGALLIADLTDRGTFDSLFDWIRGVIKAAHPKDVKVLVLANKFDLQDEVAISKQEIDEITGSLGVKYLFTSARDGTNVENAFMAMSESLARRAIMKQE